MKHHVLSRLAIRAVNLLYFGAGAGPSPMFLPAPHLLPSRSVPLSGAPLVKRRRRRCGAPRDCARARRRCWPRDGVNLSFNHDGRVPFWPIIPRATSDAGVHRLRLCRRQHARRRRAWFFLLEHSHGLGKLMHLSGASCPPSAPAVLTLRIFRAFRQSRGGVGAVGGRGGVGGG